MTRNSELTADAVNRIDGFERSFVVDVDPQAVWDAIAQPTEPKADGTAQYDIPGLEAVCSAVEVDPGKLLRMKKEEEPCMGTEVIIALEDAGSGTRVTVVQSGFGPWLPDVIEMFGYVWNMILADLKLFIETGVRIKTHLFDPASMPTVSLGCGTQDHFTGLIATQVEKAGFCQRVGVEEGDLLVSLNGVRLLNSMLLQNLLKMASAGTEFELTWVRAGELKSGRATI